MQRPVDPTGPWEPYPYHNGDSPVNEASMCLIAFAYEAHPQYRLLLAANRDEFYERPARPLATWDDRPDLYAGQDVKGGGTWLGITRSGRMAAVTNYRNPQQVLPQAPSRGFLVLDFLTGSQPAENYVEQIAAEADRYNGFNLLIGDAAGLWYLSNRSAGIHRIAPGIYGLSNHLLDTGWPKVNKSKAALQKLTEDGQTVRIEPVFDLLADRTPAPDDLLPDTGVGLPWERILSPIFITSETYGTRCSSVIRIARSGEVSFCERSFHWKNDCIHSGEDRRFDFSIDTAGR